MRHILLNSAVTLVAATLTTAAFAGDDAHKDHDKTVSGTATTQPAKVHVRTDTDLDDSARPAGAAIHAEHDKDTTTRVETRTDLDDDAVKARAEVDSDQKEQLKADKKEAKAEMKESKKELKEAKADYKDEKKDYERTTAEMERKSDKRDGTVEARGEVDTDRAQTAGSVEDGEQRNTESKPEGSDKEHLQVENPEKPHLSDK